jgi:hypothetical protein
VHKQVIGSEIDVMVMGERIKRTTRYAAGKVNQDTGAVRPGSAHPDDEGTEAAGTGGPDSAVTEHTGDDARPGATDIRRLDRRPHP